MVSARIHGDGAGKAKAWLRRLAGWLVALLAGVALLVGYLARDHTPPATRADLAEARARARLAACLIGQPPGPTAAPLLRATQIASHDDPAWPKRCIPYAKELERLDESPTSSPSTALANDDPFEVLDVSVSHAIETANNDLDFAAVTRDVPRPRPAPVLPEPGTLHEDSVDQSTGDPDLQLRFDDDAVCQLAAKDGGLEPIARCSFVADRLGFGDRRRHVELVPSTGGAPPLAFAAWREIAGWSDGRPVVAGKLESTWRTGDRTFALAAAPRPSLLVHDANGTRTLALDRPRTVAGARLFAGHLVWHERGTLYARALGESLGPVVTIGKGDAPSRSTCVAGDTAALILRDDRHLALRVGERWAVVGPISAEGRLHCLAGRAVIAHVETSRRDNAVITRTDCTLAGCTDARVELAARSEAAVAVPVGDETLVAWAHDAIWMVRGPLAALPTAKRVPVVNGFGVSARYVPYSRLVQRMHAYVRGESVVLLLASAGEPFAVHVRGDKLEAVRVVYD
jgi:hypothetical protein